MILPIYRQRSSATPEYLADIAHTKRLLERWEGDDAFRELLHQSPQQAARRYGLQADAEALRPVWDAGFDPSLPVAECVLRHRAFVGEKMAHREELRRTSRPLSPPFQAWRLRQMARTTSQLGAVRAHGIVHPLAAFELSKGCSVGCWFCGVSAPKLGDIFSYSDAHRGLWRDVCQVWREEMGPAAEQAFLYWATDPMDNPDYEKFACDFHELCGYFPQTTTALPLRDVDRTRRLLRLSEERGCLLNRFSLLTLKILDRVHEAFAAEELAFVELVLQIRKDTLSKAVAGRTLEKAIQQGVTDYQASTIACISGFLVSMVDRSVRLISPCPASPRWPLGYQVYGQGTFTSAEEFRELLRRLTSAQSMPLSVSWRQRVGFRGDLRWQVEAGGLKVSSTYLHQTFRGLDEAALEKLGARLAQGDLSAEEVALQVGADLPTVFLILNQMLAGGVLHEESEFQHAGV
jgi:radical SAM family RiPP maturation amino acid epimerase